MFSVATESQSFSDAAAPLTKTATKTTTPEGDAIRELAERIVGLIDMKEAQRVLRKAMHREAMQRTRGSHRGAAKLLGVDRRYVQRLSGEQAQ